MNTEVAVVQEEVREVASPLDLAPEVFKKGLARRGENRKALIGWVKDALVDGVDYGSVQTKRGMSKPSLRKPGAEKICGMLGVTATFPTLAHYEEAALSGKTLEQVVLRCHLQTADGRIVADGIGARSLEQDQGDLNKALKMAAKSAMIDATLRMAGLSEIFTQDLEDMPPVDGSSKAESTVDDGLVPRGKHKGKKWIEVSEDYLQWAVNSEGARAASQELKDGCQKELERRDRERTGGIGEEKDIPFAWAAVIPLAGLLSYATHAAQAML